MLLPVSTTLICARRFIVQAERMANVSDGSHATAT